MEWNAYFSWVRKKRLTSASGRKNICSSFALLSLPLIILRLGLIVGQEKAQVCSNFHMMSVKHWQMRRISAIYCFWLEYPWVCYQVYRVHIGGFPSYWSRGSLPVLLWSVSRHSRYSCSGRHWNCWPAPATTARKMAQETWQARGRERTTTSFS